MPFVPAVVLAGLLLPAADSPPLSEKDALKPLNPIVAAWKVTGSTDAREKVFWTERVDVSWQFKDGVRLVFDFEKGKHFAKWEVRYHPETKSYRLTATTASNETVQYSAKLSTSKTKLPVLTAERTLPDTKQVERLVVTQLHDNRFLYRLETRPATGVSFTRRYQAGATKEGEDFASVGRGPECVVSGGQAKIAVTHQGKTYYVCCTGCRDAFKDDPDKFVKEYEAKQKK